MTTMQQYDRAERPRHTVPEIVAFWCLLLLTAAGPIGGIFYLLLAAGDQHAFDAISVFMVAVGAWLLCLVLLMALAASSDATH